MSLTTDPTGHGLSGESGDGLHLHQGPVDEDQVNVFALACPDGEALPGYLRAEYLEMYHAVMRTDFMEVISPLEYRWDL